MKQVTWHGKNIFTLDDVPDLNPQEGWVKIKIDTVGICGTDVHITQGLFPATPPQVLGHEASGIISEVGIGVDKKRIGERVTINTSSSCGNCKNCIDWTISRCENAERSTPFFSEFSFAPNQNAIKIPDDLDLEIACMTEPASCCLSGVKMLSNLENSRALVIGGGIMGQFCAGFLKNLREF